MLVSQFFSGWLPLCLQNFRAGIDLTFDFVTKSSSLVFLLTIHGKKSKITEYL